MNFVKFILLWLISQFAIAYSIALFRWLLTFRKYKVTLRESLLRQTLHSGLFPYVWIVYWGLVTRTFCAHASRTMFVVYLATGFLLGYGLISSDGQSYSAKDLRFIGFYISWLVFLFIVLRNPGNLGGLIR